MQQLINNLLAADTNQEYEAASNACMAFLNSNASEEDKAKVKQAITKKSEIVLQNSRESRKTAERFLEELEMKEVDILVNGQVYPLKEWVTIKDYCDLFNLNSTSIVTNWIKRGIIPKENILQIRQLNNLKLVKAIPYMG